jgi:hypothetical protein
MNLGWDTVQQAGLLPPGGAAAETQAAAPLGRAAGV